jgi:hypothetical protein
VICLVTQAEICQIILLFTNDFEGICDDYFLIIFDAKEGIWTVCGGVSAFTNGVMG